MGPGAPVCVCQGGNPTVLPGLRAAQQAPACHFLSPVLLSCVPSSGEGVWSNQGCVLTEGNLSYSVCRCTHLTNFAILMQVVPMEVRARRRGSRARRRGSRARQRALPTSGCGRGTRVAPTQRGDSVIGDICEALHFLAKKTKTKQNFCFKFPEAVPVQTWVLAEGPRAEGLCASIRGFGPRAVEPQCCGRVGRGESSTVAGGVGICPPL